MKPLSIVKFFSHKLLCEKCPYSEFFCSVFSHIRTEYGPEKLRIWTLFTQCMCGEKLSPFRNSKINFWESIFLSILIRDCVCAYAWIQVLEIRLWGTCSVHLCFWEACGCESVQEHSLVGSPAGKSSEKFCKIH